MLTCVTLSYAQLDANTNGEFTGGSGGGSGSTTCTPSFFYSPYISDLGMIELNTSDSSRQSHGVVSFPEFSHSGAAADCANLLSYEIKFGDLGQYTTIKDRTTSVADFRLEFQSYNFLPTPYYLAVTVKLTDSSGYIYRSLNMIVYYGAGHKPSDATYQSLFPPETCTCGLSTSLMSTGLVYVDYPNAHDFDLGISCPGIECTLEQLSAD